MAHVTANIVQQAFRGRNDDGSETSATWIAALNTNWTQTADEFFRVRFHIEETAGGGNNNVDHLLEYQVNGGGWASVGTTTPIQFGASANVTDATATTQQISTGTFLAGEYDQNGAITNPVSYAGNDETEMEYGVLIDSAQVSDGDLIELRVNEDGAALSGGYTSTPTITADIPVAAVTGDLATTEAQDTATASGDVVVSGDLAATEAQDTASLSGGTLQSSLPVTDGLVIDLDASLLSLTDSDPVSDWIDSSVYNNNAKQITATNQPTYHVNVLNGQPAVYFDGTDDYLLVDPDTSFNYTEATTLFVVASADDFSVRRISFNKEGHYRLLDADPEYLIHVGDANGWFTETAGTLSGYNLPTQTAFILEITIDWVNGETVGYHDGVEIFRQSFAAGALISPSISDLTIGSFDGTDFLWKGYHGQIASYDRLLTSQERDDVRAFLSDKWIGEISLQGDLAATETQDTAAASGEVLVQGDLAATEVQDTAAISGDVLVAGALSATESQDTATFSGATISEGDLAATETQDSATASGIVVVSGDIAATENADTANLSGSLKTFGDISASETADSAAASGDVLIAGTIDATESQDTASISAGSSLQGDLAATEAQDAASVTGGVTTFADLAVTEAQDSASASGQVLVSGDIAATETQDTASISAGSQLQGSLAATEAQDTATVSGSLKTFGDLIATETQDSASAAGQIIVQGALSATESQDTAAISAGSTLQGDLAVTETADTATASGSVLAAGSLSATETQDSAAASGGVLVSGDIAATESQDTASLSAGSQAQGDIAVTETQDTATASGTVATTGALSATEAQDGASISGTVATFGELVASETADGAAITGQIVVSGLLSASESQDVFAASTVPTLAAPSISVRVPPDIRQLLISRGLYRIRVKGSASVQIDQDPRRLRIPKTGRDIDA